MPSDATSTPATAPAAPTAPPGPLRAFWNAFRENRGAVIGHHVRLDDFVSIGPGVVTGGHVSVGRGSVVGTGAVILPEIAIGKNAVVGAGAVVTRDVPDQTMVVGNPARVMRDGVGGYRGMAVD